ncbi:hypothetical protein [Paenibacillus apii]|uniref:hypothetical protein n=1 Tax=Paenibacillus apii TaxID=1850370 RepID=UPI00143A061C|nr:hypothetical protein [Paenibacillus apii]NJJ38261.1 hypothetical protein [Paenibacillus apii]
MGRYNWKITEFRLESIFQNKKIASTSHTLLEPEQLNAPIPLPLVPLLTCSCFCHCLFISLGFSACKKGSLQFQQVE